MGRRLSCCVLFIFYPQGWVQSSPLCSTASKGITKPLGGAQCSGQRTRNRVPALPQGWPQPQATQEVRALSNPHRHLGKGSLGAEERRGCPREKRAAEGTLHSGINQHRSRSLTLHRGSEGPEELGSDKHSLQGQIGPRANLD